MEPGLARQGTPLVVLVSMWCSVCRKKKEMPWSFWSFQSALGNKTKHHPQQVSSNPWPQRVGSRQAAFHIWDCPIWRIISMQKSFLDLSWSTLVPPLLSQCLSQSLVPSYCLQMVLTSSVSFHQSCSLLVIFQVCKKWRKQTGSADVFKLFFRCLSTVFSLTPALSCLMLQSGIFKFNFFVAPGLLCVAVNSEKAFGAGLLCLILRWICI